MNNLRIKIGNLLLQNKKMILKHFNNKEIKIINNFSNLNDSFNIKVFHYFNNIKNKPKCKNCNKETKFVRFSIGYREFCSCKCKNDFIFDDNLKNKISNTLKIYHKNLSQKERDSQQRKRSITLSKKIKIKKINSDFYEYKKLVRKFTRKNNLKYPKNFHLDHMFSIYYGFKNNILPQIIGHISNLSIISKHENTSKKEKCSKTPNELFKDYFNSFKSSTTIPKGGRTKWFETADINFEFKMYQNL